MKKKIQKNIPDIVFILSVLYLELVFQLHIFQQLTIDYIYSILFGISMMLFLLLVCHLFNEKVNKFLSSCFLILIILIFMIQMIYYDVFKVFTSLYSVFHGTGQVIGFSNEIVNAVLKNADVVILCLLPLIFYLIAIRKYEMRRISFKNGCIRFLFCGAFYLSGLFCLMLPHEGMESTLELYLNCKPTTTLMKRFGVTTSFRLQIREMMIQFDTKSNKKMIKPLPDSQNEEQKVNQMDIDFDALIRDESDPVIKNMHQYFASLSASHQNEYTGMFEGYNLIMITAEAFSDYAIDEELTPTLYKMKNEGFDFKNFYNPLWEVSTSDGEYVNCFSLYPKPGVWSFSRTTGHAVPFTFGAQYQKMGIETFAYHNHYYDFYDRDQTHTYVWKNYKGLGNGLNVTNVWPESDLEMIEKTSDEYMQLEHFHTYFMSVSGHLNYTWSGNSMSSKNYDAVSHLELDELSKGYLAAQIELDKAMEQLLKDLERYDHLDDTLIVIAPDHYPYGLDNANIEELSGRKIEDAFDLYRSTMIIYAPSMTKKIEVDTLCSSIDILPTVSNLLALEYDSRLLMGCDIFSDQKPLIVLADGSFMNDEVKYDAHSGRVEYMKQRVSDSRVKALYEKASKKLEISSLILEKDYYRFLGL